MRIDKDYLLHRVEYAKQCVLSKMQSVPMNKNDYLTWPLFFTESAVQQESEVDVCTSALGVIAMAAIFESSQDKIASIMNKGISTILFVRNEDGSWPSKISLVSKDEISMEGVITDTFYALLALMKIKFLSNSPLTSEIYDSKNNKMLSSLTDRLSIINASVNWLLNNRVGQGWQYTGVGYIEDGINKDQLLPYTMPSANVLIVLSEIMEAISIIDPKNILINKIQDSINDTVSWFCEIWNKDGGFGVKRGDPSRVSNTARVVVTLCSVSYSEKLNERVNNVINKAIKWIIKSYKPQKLNFEDVSEDFSQLIIDSSGDAVKAYRRSAIHESFVEPLIIDALSSYYIKYCKQTQKKKQFLLNSKVFITMKKAVEHLMCSQEIDGKFQGAVKSRRQLPNESYTMYCCCDTICSLKKLCDSTDVFSKLKNVSRCSIIIVLVYVFSFIVLLIPCFISNQPLLLSLELLVLNPVAANIISSLIDKAL